MKKAVWPILLCLALPASSLGAEGSRFYEFTSDYLQALHLGYWASGVDVNGRRPLVTLVLSLDEQRQRLNQAREILLHHEAQPAAEGRRAVEALLNGIELFSLIATDDMADIDAMNNRAELAQRLDDRTDQRQQAVFVMAGSVQYMREALMQRVAPSPDDKRHLPFRVSADEAASLWKQATLFFGEDIAVGGGRTSPVLAEIEDLRRTLKRISEVSSPLERLKK